MKYIKKYEEIQSEIKNDVEKVFDSEDWLVVKPKTIEALYKLAEDQGWEDIERDINRQYKRFNNETLQYIYINIKKSDDSKVLFDFKNSDFYGQDEEQIYLKDFLENKPKLLSYYGEILPNGGIAKEGDDFWMVVDDYEDFKEYFKLDRGTRDDLIEKILSGDSFELFESSENEDPKNANIKMDSENIIVSKIILLIEKIKNDYDYDSEDIINIKDYDDVVEIVYENDIDTFKDVLIFSLNDAIRDATESAAYEHVTDAIYKFFNFELGSAKWQNYKGSKNQKLWIKFKNKNDAYMFKLRYYDEEGFEDYEIEYSPPYYGYSPKHKAIEDSFNELFLDKVSWEYTNYSDTIEHFKEKWDNLNKDEILEDIRLYDKMKQFNL